MSEMRDIRCPLCESFVIRVRTGAAEIGARCLNRRCRARVAIRIVEGKVSVEAEAYKHQAT